MFEEQLREKDGKLQTYTNRWEDAIVEPPVPPLPELNNVIDSTSEVSADVLTDDDKNYIRISIESDAESGDLIVSADLQGIFADERYTIQEHNVWADLFESIMNVDNVKSMIEYATSFPEEIFTAMNTYYNNPTLENAQSLAVLLQNWTPLPPLNNAIEDSNESSVDVLTDGDENYIEVSIEMDPETEVQTVVATPYGIFDDSRYVGGSNLWSSLFEILAPEMVIAMKEISEFPSDIFAALEDFYEDPTDENYDAAEEALSNWR